MKKIIVTQACIGHDIISDQKKTRQKYVFTKPIPCGEYTEKDFVDLVGKDFMASKHFEKFCQCGFIQVIEYKDITTKYKEKASK